MHSLFADGMHAFQPVSPPSWIIDVDLGASTQLDAKRDSQRSSDETLSLIFTSFVNISLFLYVPGKLPARGEGLQAFVQLRDSLSHLSPPPFVISFTGEFFFDLLDPRIRESVVWQDYLLFDGKRIVSSRVYLSWRKFIDDLIKLNRTDRRGN